MKIALDEGYQFGLGVFETIAVEKNNPLLLEEHLERMQHSLCALHINKTIKADEVFDFLSGHHLEHHALKMMVSDENTLFTVRPNPYPVCTGTETAAESARTFRLRISCVRRNETSPLVFHKTMNYADNLLEKRRALRDGFDEVLFCNSRGELCEGAATNLFFVRNGELLTPQLSCGILPGVMRRFILEHFPVTECVLYPSELSSVEECFVTNSLMGVMPVRCLDDHIFYRYSMCAHIRNFYAEYVREYLLSFRKL